MKVRASAFATEADLCRAFTEWALATGSVAAVFSEWAGWDLVVALNDGRQVGVQAKLRLSAEVLAQALVGVEDGWFLRSGPDHRAVLVPQRRVTAASNTLARQLGLAVFAPASWGRGQFEPDLTRAVVGGFVDWNPSSRLELPPTQTDSLAGSPCPVTLTPWKLRALDVLAEIEVFGAITTRRMSSLRVAPSRWLTGRWLVPGPSRGEWIRGEHCPAFDQQHPSAFAVALAAARAPERAVERAAEAAKRPIRRGRRDGQAALLDEAAP